MGYNYGWIKTAAMATEETGLKPQPWRPKQRSPKGSDLNRSPGDRRGTLRVPWVRSTPEGVKGVRFRRA